MDSGTSQDWRSVDYWVECHAKELETKSDMIVKIIWSTTWIISEDVEYLTGKQTFFLPEMLHWFTSKILLYLFSSTLGQNVYT